MITFFFFLLIPYPTPLNFNFPSIGPNESLSLNCTGDAYISIKGIQLTPNPDEFNGSSLIRKAGRATFVQPLHLWDQASGNLTNFSTNFSFVIQGNNYGEGLAFFLAPNGSSIPPGSAGGGLGLINETQKTNTSGSNAFVAVKFDTYMSSWEYDLGFPINHVGININSRYPVATKIWDSGITDGETNQAQIKYNSSTQNLSVVFTNFVDNTTITRNLYYAVDLRALLPEWVVFGFSASTGVSYEKCRIL